MHAELARDPLSCCGRYEGNATRFPQLSQEQESAVRTYILFVSLLLAATVARIPSSYAGPTLDSADRYSVEIAVTATDSLQSVQLTIDYRAVPGAFVGAGSDVACTPNPDLRALAAFYRCDPTASSGCMTEGQLNAAMVLPEAVSGTLSLFTCTFESAGQTPTAEGFVVHLGESARMSNGRAIPVTATARITSVSSVTR